MAAALAAACGGGSARDVIAPPAVNPPTTASGVYALATIDGQPLPIEITRTANARDTLVADTLSLSGRVDSSVARTRFMHYVVFGGIGAGRHQATFPAYDGGWRMRGGKPFIWVTDNQPDSVALAVPDVSTVAFTRGDHLYVYKR